MSRKEVAMVFVIANAVFLLAENPFSAEESAAANRIALKFRNAPTADELDQCLAYVKASLKG